MQEFLFAHSDFLPSHWLIFSVVVLGLSYVDWKLPEKNRPYSIIMWVGTSLIGYVLIKYLYKTGVIGTDHSLDFLTSYFIELSLSIDNVFVFIVIFERLNITGYRRDKILTIGIISAIILRMIMVLFAVSLIQKFVFIFYVFGGILIASAVKMLVMKDDKSSLQSDQKSKYFIETEDASFFKRVDGKLFATINLLALILVEKADLMFAIDSIPAIISVTQDLFVIFAVNAMAVSGLKSLFCILSKANNKYEYLRYGICVILIYIGVKMILIPLDIHMPTVMSLSIIVGIMGVSVVASIAKSKMNDKKIA